MQAVLPSPELTLLRDCCRAGFKRKPGTALSIPGELDWNKLRLLARRHRVEGLVNKALTSSTDMPANVRQHFAKEGRRIALHGMACVAETARLQRALTSAGLRPIFLKGLPLATQVYADPLAKESIDIDLLVTPDELEVAAEALQTLDYQPAPPVTVDRLARWHRRSKESDWTGAAGVHVDLHSRLGNLPETLRRMDAREAAVTTQIAPGVTVETLGGPGLIAYLAVHGGSSAWFRLKWLADFAGLLDSLEEGTLDEAYRQARGLVDGPEVDLAFALSHRLFGTDLPPIDQKVEKLLPLVETCLFGDDEPTARRWGTLPLHLFQLRLQPAWGGRLREIERQLFHASAARGLY